MMRKPSTRCPLYPGMRSGCARRRLKSACSTYAETSRAVATMRPKVGIVIGPRCKKGIINWTSEYTRRRPEARKPPLNHVRWIGGNTRGNLLGCENKGVAGKAIRKDMKTKGQ